MVIIITMDNSRFSRALFPAGLLALLALVAPLAEASESVTVYWDKNSETDVAGYRVHYGTLANPYASTIQYHRSCLRYDLPDVGLRLQYRWL